MQYKICITKQDQVFIAEAILNYLIKYKQDAEIIKFYQDKNNDGSIFQRHVTLLVFQDFKHLAQLFLLHYNSRETVKSKFKKALLYFLEYIYFGDERILLHLGKVKTAAILFKKIYLLFIDPLLEILMTKILQVKIEHLYKYDLTELTQKVDLLELSTDNFLFRNGDKVAICADIDHGSKVDDIIKKAVIDNKNHSNIVLYGAIQSGLYFYQTIEPYIKSGEIKFAGNVLNFNLILSDIKKLYTSDCETKYTELTYFCKANNIPFEICKLKQSKININNLLTL